MQAIVQLWLRALHAALYHEPLLSTTRFAIETPLPKARLASGNVELVPLRVEQHRLVVQTLKRERAGGNVDRILCNNGKLLYECVWDQFDDGTWLCVFGVDLYGWADLYDTRNFERRGCAGGYFLRVLWSSIAGAVDAASGVVAPGSGLAGPASNFQWSWSSGTVAGSSAGR